MNALLVKVTDAVPVNGWYNARVVRLCIGEQGEPSFVEAGSLKVCRAAAGLGDLRSRDGRTRDRRFLPGHRTRDLVRRQGRGRPMNIRPEKPVRACPGCKGECVQFVSRYIVAMADRTVSWSNLVVLCPVCGGEGVLDVPARPVARRNGELLN